MRTRQYTWVGNGTSQNLVNGDETLTPIAVFVKDDDEIVVFKLASMATSASAGLNPGDGFTNDGVTALITGGFSVGVNPRVNGSGKTYHAVALFDTGDGDIIASGHTGDGVAGRVLATGLANVGLFICKRLGTTVAVHSTTAFPAGESSQFNAVAFGNDITAMSGGNVTLSNSVRVNSNGGVFYTLSVSIGTGMDVMSWTGNATDDRLIATDVQPVFATAKRNGATAGAIRMDTMPDGYSGLYSADALSTGKIKAFQSGGFVVGTDDSVNASGSTYCGFVFAANVALGGIANLLGGKLIAGNLVRGGLAA